jgi:hypothetical protein
MIEGVDNEKGVELMQEKIRLLKYYFCKFKELKKEAEKAQITLFYGSELPLYDRYEDLLQDFRETLCMFRGE